MGWDRERERGSTKNVLERYRKKRCQGGEGDSKKEISGEGLKRHPEVGKGKQDVRGGIERKKPQKGGPEKNNQGQRQGKIISLLSIEIVTPLPQKSADEIF